MTWGAVIFDFDGVLGRTMEDNYAAWARACADMSMPLEREEYFVLEGLNVRAVARTLLRRNGMDPELAQRLAALKERYYLENHAFALYPGAMALLDGLGRRLPLGLVTGAGRARLDATLPKNFLKHFQVVVNGDQVRHPKPHPEPYLAGVSALGLAPQQAIAVENAPLGIRSAKAGGLYCLGISSTLGRVHLQEADWVVADLAAAGAHIDSMLE